MTAAVSEHDIADKICECIQGNYVVYGVGAYRSLQWCVNDVQLAFSSERKGLRAYREARREAGKCVKPAGETGLSDELVVIFGPDLSPHKAVATLEKLTQHIKENGLLVGKGRESEDVYYVEKLDGTVRHC